MGSEKGGCGAVANVHVCVGVMSIISHFNSPLSAPL